MTRRKRSFGWLYWLLVLILLVGAVVIAYLVWDNYFNDNKSNGDDITIQIDDEDNNKINDEKEENKQKNESVEKKRVEQYDGDDPNKSMELSGVITYAQVVDNKLMIRVNIDQYLDDGDCELIINRDGNTIYTNATKIFSSASTSTCEGFDIATNELGKGKVELEVMLKSGGRNGVINGSVDL